MRIGAISLVGLLTRFNQVIAQQQVIVPNGQFDGYNIQNEDQVIEWTGAAVPDVSLLASELVDIEIEIVEELPEEEALADKTIYEILSTVPIFSRVLKAIDFDDETAELFKDSSANITFFAPDNDALPKRPDRKKGFMPHDYSMLSLIDDLEEPSDSLSVDEDEDEDKKKLLKKLVHAILSYHVLPEGLDAAGLGLKGTHATSLNAADGSIGGSARRISVIPPILKMKHGGAVNLYAKFKRADIKAKNGVIHVINHPLIPPLSVLESTFLAQNAFSVWTSSLQKVGLADATEYRVLPKFTGIANKTTAPTVTVFLPINSAWRHLPKGLQLFLFSPFGERALKKLLQLHIVPNFILHADWTYNASLSDEYHVGEWEYALTPISADHVNVHNWMDDKWASQMSMHQRSPLLLHDMPVPNVGGCMPPGLLPDLLDPIHRVGGLSHFAKWRRPSASTPCGCSEGRPGTWRLQADVDDPNPTERPDPPKWPGPPKPPKVPPFPKPPKVPNPPKPPKVPPPPKPPKIPAPPTPPKVPKPPGRRPRPLPPHKKPKLTMNETVTLPTLLTNFALDVHITRTECHLLPESLTTKVVVNGIPVILPDAVARNGAVHVVSRLLHPLKRHKRRHPDGECSADSCEDMGLYDVEDLEDWEDWRDWLPQWAMED